LAAKNSDFVEIAQAIPASIFAFFAQNYFVSRRKVIKQQVYLSNKKTR